MCLTVPEKIKETESNASEFESDVCIRYNSDSHNNGCVASETNNRANNIKIERPYLFPSL